MGGFVASSGLDCEAVAEAVGSEGRSGVEILESVPSGAGGGRIEGLSCCHVLSGECNPGSGVEGLTGVSGIDLCGVESLRVGVCVPMAIGGEVARMIED